MSPKKSKPKPSPIFLHVRVTHDEKKVFQKAAEEQHLSLSDWIRQVALRACKEIP